MKTFVYIIQTNNSFLHVGYCRDVKAMVKFYKGLPNLVYTANEFNKLVYVEEHPDKESAINRFNEINDFTKEIKEIIIEGVNPDYVDLIPGLNFDLI